MALVVAWRQRQTYSPSWRPQVAKAAMMTQQYLVGELSLMLGELEESVPDEAVSRAIADLRRTAEATRPTLLAPVLGCALVLANRVCARDFVTGAYTAFLRDLSICAELRAWGVCAGFLREHPGTD
jgi:hypothetical protein